MQKITNSEKKTYRFAKDFAKTLSGGAIIGLTGELGAGKTIFTKGLAAGLGIKETINSPTFVLMKIYPVKKHKNIKQLCHIDAYRIKNENDIMVIGADEYFSRNDTISVIEWADKIKNLLPKKFLNVKITNKEKNKRIINY
jgi:tRNA threonylcarbamoyladenosine biosynthesis protein TsaE